MCNSSSVAAAAALGSSSSGRGSSSNMPPPLKAPPTGKPPPPDLQRSTPLFNAAPVPKPPPPSPDTLGPSTSGVLEPGDRLFARGPDLGGAFIPEFSAGPLSPRSPRRSGQWASHPTILIGSSRMLQELLGVSLLGAPYKFLAAMEWAIRDSSPDTWAF